jgi:HEAT repeat protein
MLCSVALAAWLVYWAREQRRTATQKTETPSVSAEPAVKTETPASKFEVPAPVAYQPPTVTDEKLGKLVNRQAKVSERISADMTSRFPAVTDPADQAALAKVLEDAKDDDTVRNEVANLLRRSKYPGLEDSLIRVLKNPEEKERFRAFAVQHLGVSFTQAGLEKREVYGQELRGLLNDRDTSVKRESLLALVLAKDETGKETAEKWLVEKSESADKMRDLTIRCIRELGLKQYLPQLRELAASPNEPVKIAAIVTLSEWKDVESKKIFEEAANSSSARLKGAGKMALQKLK